MRLQVMELSAAVAVEAVTHHLLADQEVVGLAVAETLVTATAILAETLELLLLVAVVVAVARGRVVVQDYVLFVQQAL